MLKDSQVDLCGRTDFTRTAPLLARDEAFSFNTLSPQLFDN